jgi:hypothetical protein
LLAIQETRNLENDLINAMKDIYKDTFVIHKTGNLATEQFKTHVGLRQGCAL